MENNIKDIIKNIYTFSYFVQKMEVEYGMLDSWLDMEIINALVLNEWDEKGRPADWNEWDLLYKGDAEEVLLCFLLEAKMNQVI